MRGSRLLFLSCALPLLTATSLVSGPKPPPASPVPASPLPHTPQLALQAAAPAPQPQALVLSASHWTSVPLPATPLGIAAHGNELWVCGWNGLIAESTDAGRTWRIRH